MIQLRSIAQRLAQDLTRAHAYAIGGYLAAMAGFAMILWLALASLADDYSTYSAASDRLDALEGRGKRTSQGGADLGPIATGSPFLEGRTVSVAGAALQQRVVAAVGQVGGNVLSSQIDLHGPLAEQGYVSMTANCEIVQTALQQLLYDLEAGMPFLFIDQLIIQTPQTVGEREGAALRVRIDVSGQWRAAAK